MTHIRVKTGEDKQVDLIENRNEAKTLNTNSRKTNFNIRQQMHTGHSSECPFKIMSDKLKETN